MVLYNFLYDKNGPYKRPFVSAVWGAMDAIISDMNRRFNGKVNQMKKLLFQLRYFPLVVLCLTAQAQENSPENVQITSPTAASLVKVADVPVNLHTGIPNISIPIYTVEEGPLQLPISLSYHAGGLKVSEQARLGRGRVVTQCWWCDY